MPNGMDLTAPCRARRAGRDQPNLADRRPRRAADPIPGRANHDHSHLVPKAFEKPSGRPDLNRRPLDPQSRIRVQTPFSRRRNYRLGSWSEHYFE